MTHCSRPTTATSIPAGLGLSMPRTRIKICGITDEQALVAAAQAGADAIGFMFVQGSPRVIDPEEAFALATMLPPFMATVGVFADPDPDAFAEFEQLCPTTCTQLHGDEDAKLVRTLGPDIIKAVRFDPSTIRDALARWDADENVGAILVDGSSGGEGVAFDWAALTPHLAGLLKPVILAGGLTPENVEEAIRAVRPYAVDVSSGVESSRGVKDASRIQAFCDAVRRADAH